MLVFQEICNYGCFLWEFLLSPDLLLATNMEQFLIWLLVLLLFLDTMGETHLYSSSREASGGSVGIN